MSEETKLIGGIRHRKIECQRCHEMIWVTMHQPEAGYACKTCVQPKRLWESRHLDTPSSEHRYNG